MKWSPPTTTSNQSSGIWWSGDERTRTSVASHCDHASAACPPVGYEGAEIAALLGVGIIVSFVVAIVSRTASENESTARGPRNRS